MGDNATKSKFPKLKICNGHLILHCLAHLLQILLLDVDGQTVHLLIHDLLDGFGLQETGRVAENLPAQLGAFDDGLDVLVVVHPIVLLSIDDALHNLPGEHQAANPLVVVKELLHAQILSFLLSSSKAKQKNKTPPGTLIIIIIIINHHQSSLSIIIHQSKPKTKKTKAQLQ